MSPQIELPPLLRSPLFYFGVWASANGLLSYGSLPLSARLWIGLTGILLPWAFYRMERPKQKGGTDPFELKSFNVPKGLVFIALGLALFFRFYRLTDLSLWPDKNEGIFGSNAVESSIHWDLPFFFSVGDDPPFYRFLQAVFFKWVPPSLLSLWLLPALLSSATLFAAYAASKQFFSRSFSLLLAGLFALGFWPLYLGRFSMIGVLLLLWECLALGFWGAFLKARSSLARKITMAGLGLCVAGGFYIYVSWAAAALVTGLFLFYWAATDWKKRRTFFLLFVAVTAAGFIPFGWEAIRHGYGAHIRDMGEVKGAFSPAERLALCGRYLAEIFWGADIKGFCFGPFWGGFLNPIAGSLLMVGAAELSVRGRRGVFGGMVCAFFILMLPGFASHDVEMLRVLIVIPLLFILMAAGFSLLVSCVPSPRRGILAVLLLAFSSLLDIYHLTVPYAKAWDPRGDYLKSTKSEESLNAFQIMKAKALKDGPGWLFLDYVAVPLDQTLLIASYPFNAVYHPLPGGATPRWMAFLTNVNYEPFLRERFPEAQWFILGSQLMPWDGELMLGVLPVTPRTQTTADQWLKAQTAFHQLTRDILLQGEGRSREEIVEKFLREYPRIQGDPFLESVFWEAAYFNHSADKNFLASMADLRRVLRDGYPAAHIFNELGGLMWFKKDEASARRAFSKAVQLGGAHTPAMDNLRAMEAELK